MVEAGLDGMGWDFFGGIEEFDVEVGVIVFKWVVVLFSHPICGGTSLIFIYHRILPSSQTASVRRKDCVADSP